VTIFTPNNAAFAAAANYTSNAATLPNLLSNHVIPNFLGYLPVLTNGAVYQTLANETLTISIKNGVYYVNGAQIISSNTILTNGVAHVIDQASLRLVSRVEGLLTDSVQVLVPTPTPTPVFISASSPLTCGCSVFVAAGVAIAATMVATLIL
jgi:hypothetical protein